MDLQLWLHPASCKGGQAPVQSPLVVLLAATLPCAVGSDDAPGGPVVRVTHGPINTPWPACP
jgi:hypothetical protein